jgi:FKBP12-rapamycin complex-associated protein
LNLGYLFRLYNYCKDLLSNADNNLVIAAAKVMGRIAAEGGTLFTEAFVDAEVTDAVGRIQRNEQGRYGFVLILKELARQLPHLFLMHIVLIFEKLLIPLRDTRVRFSVFSILTVY